jgi:enoyl-CoA hydratase/carnithine racemase
LNSVTEHYLLEEREHCSVLHLVSADGMNRLSRDRVQALTDLLCELTTNQSHRSADHASKALIITGNQHFFSAGADLNEIASLSGPAALEFAKMGQRLMRLVDDFPARVFAAVSGYCMGGGLDLALACDVRICSGNALFGHRGAALGLITGWGGTQRLSRLVGRGRALQMFVAAEKLGAAEALDARLVSEIVADPVARCVEAAERIYSQNVPAET